MRFGYQAWEKLIKSDEHGFTIDGGSKGLSRRLLAAAVRDIKQELEDKIADLT